MLDLAAEELDSSGIIHHPLKMHSNAGRLHRLRSSLKEVHQRRLHQLAASVLVSPDLTLSKLYHQTLPFQNCFTRLDPFQNQQQTLSIAFNKLTRAENCLPASEWQPQFCFVPTRADSCLVAISQTRVCAGKFWWVEKGKIQKNV